MHIQNSHPKPVLLHHLLPEEIIEEILSKLPVKSLLRLRCVSESWLSLIESDRFINKHLKIATKNPSLAHHIVVYDNGDVSRCSLQALLSSLNSNSNSKERSSASASALASSINIDPPNNLPTSEICVVGCCNGLVLCVKYKYRDRSFILWNPATRVFMELPKSDRIYRKYGFGWDESSGAFKVFTTSIVTNYDYDGEISISGQVYSSKTNSWKTVRSGRVDYLSNRMGVVVCGRIHWHMKQTFDGFIESFNLEDDEFGRIEPPPSNAIADLAAGGRGRPETWLGEIWGCLCGLLDYTTSLDVWVMKEYGVKESWFKLLTFPLHYEKVSTVAHPLCGEGLNGDIFFIFREKLMVYSPNKDDNFPKIANFGKSYATHVYVESLVSPLVTSGGSGSGTNIVRRRGSKPS